ncbi:4Fe-4S dicluster domain-containing protein [Dehalobacter sp. UNSWDHB]|uniref:4Fe-4S dicluster domain-containing protein n=1 Tax=Dehalobacter sp. UNSWDHB TaxID=1339256 RepID=UPI00054FD9AE|nr:4Fe-4S dicluster domain-containing protein [Dehalobacter sp. UNSWDHB]
MRQVGFLIDIKRCMGCRSCEVACKNFRNLSETQRYRRVKCVDWEQDGEMGIYYLSISCNHCENPACLMVCPNHTYRKRRDGIVVHDPGLCDGCCRCVKACPYEAPQYDEATGKVDKCDLCVERLDRGKRPFCEESCVNGALHIIFINRELDPGLHKTLPGFPDIRLTRPSVRFLPPKLSKQWRQKSL